MTAAMLQPGQPSGVSSGFPGADYAPRLSRPALIAVAVGHACLLAVLVFPRAPALVTPPKPLMVSLIAPEVKEPEPTLPKPEPTPASHTPVSKPLPPPPVLVAERPSTTSQPVLEAPKPAPEPVPEVLPPPAPPAVAEAPRPAPPPPPTTPPRPASYLSKPEPPYPALSRRLREEGEVRLNVLVNPDGSVARTEIAKSSGYPRLDEVAGKTVQSSWKFEPARQDGKPIQAWVVVPIQFNLGS